MQLYVILMFLISLLLVITSAWSLATFNRLRLASKKYKNSAVFNAACQISKSYVDIGIVTGTIITILSIIILVIASWCVYKSF
jgi:hypothetical protein